jgi:hypothetical protein
MIPAVHFAHAEVSRVGNIYVARRVDGHTLRIVQSGVDGEASIAGKRGNAVAGEGRNGLRTRGHAPSARQIAGTTKEILIWNISVLLSTKMGPGRLRRLPRLCSSTSAKTARPPIPTIRSEFIG